MNMMKSIVDKDDYHSKTGSCFYCGSTVGDAHKYDCVKRKKPVVITVDGIKFIDEKPEYWDTTTTASYYRGSGIQFVWTRASFALERDVWGVKVRFRRFASAADILSLTNICQVPNKSIQGQLVDAESISQFANWLRYMEGVDSAISVLESCPWQANWAESLAYLNRWREFASETPKP